MTSTELLYTAGMMVAAYLLGSVPFSFLVARARGVDLRTVGSGNIGGSNVWRTVGFGAFLVAVTGDILKGMVPALLAKDWLLLPPVAVVLVGMAAILGHTFPVYLRFKGGKAVATSGGVLLALKPLLLLIGLGVWILLFLTVRISSVASLVAVLVAAIAATVLYVLGDLPLAYTCFVWLAFVLIVWLHRDNIQRLRNGTENRFTRLSR